MIPGFVLAGLVGCSLAIHGGTLVSKGSSSITEYLVNYQSKGTVPNGTTYHLVRTPRGLAMFEKESRGGGALFENHWTAPDGDHFVAWIYLPNGGSSRHGYEFIVPNNRSKEALRYVYPWGTYTVQNINGVERPVPMNPVEPVTRLIPTR
jgi:hypothetical protein